MIHPAINKTEVAVRYYNGRGYTRETARKIFHQEKNKDKKLIASIIKSIFKEQKELLK